MSGSDFFGPVAALLLVLAMIPAALWLLKRTPLGGAGSGTAPMRVVGALALAPNQRLLTVEVGQGDERRWLVLGVSQAGIQPLHQMAPQAEAPAAPAAAAGSVFAQLLQRQGGRDAR